MTDHDPSQYAIEASYHGAVQLICLTCRDSSNWNIHGIATWIPGEDATLARQDFYAREHHIKHHQPQEDQ